MTQPAALPSPGVVHADAAAALATVGRLAAAVVIAAHGLVHLMGVALLWQLGEPGELTYADAVPEPGTAAAYAVGALWIAACIGFVAAAVLLAARRPSWAPVALVSAVVSTAVVAPGAFAESGQGMVGIVLDVVIAGAAATAWAWDRRGTATGAS